MNEPIIFGQQPGWSAVSDRCGGMFISGIVIVIVLLLAYILLGGRERMGGPGPDPTSPGLTDYPMGLQSFGPRALPTLAVTPMPAPEIGSQPYVRLYEAPGLVDLAYDFTPQSRDIGSGYMRLMLPINLKSLDIVLPQRDKLYDPQMYVRIWAMYGGENIASTESGFYNAYTEPDWARRANPAKYTLIAAVAAGEHLVADLTLPIKRIFLECSLM